MTGKELHAALTMKEVHTMNRRGAGEGSIVKRADGRWMAQVDLGWANGRRQRKFLYGKTRQDVARKLSVALRAHQEGMPMSNERVTVEAFLKDWLASSRGTVRPKTWQTYECYIRRHAIPALGRLPLAKLEPRHLQRLYSDKLEAGLSPTSVHHLHAILHRALGRAARLGVVPRNVASLVDAPPMTHHEMRTLSPDEARRFLLAAADDRLEGLYVLALTTGMRQGELFRLRWADVNLEAQSLAVRGQTKTAKSRRQVLLSDVAVEALRRHAGRQGDECQAAGSLWQENGLVFANTVGGSLTTTNVTYRSFRPLLEAAGLPLIRFHDLRHTAATLLLGKGVHPKVVSELLGHSQVGVTLDLYSHVTPAMHRQAVLTFDELLRS
jgi:integrase